MLVDSRMRPTAQCVFPDPNRLDTCIGDNALAESPRSGHHAERREMRLPLPIMRDGRDYSLAMSVHPGTSLSVFQTGKPRSCASRTSSSAPLEDPGSRNTASLWRWESRLAHSGRVTYYLWLGDAPRISPEKRRCRQLDRIVEC